MSTDWKKKYEKSQDDYALLEQWCNHVESNRHEAVLELQYEKGRADGLVKALELLCRKRVEAVHTSCRQDESPF